MANRLPRLIWLALATACVFPTDRSADVTVEFVTQPPLLADGDSLPLEARVLDPGGTPVEGALLVFMTSNPAVAILE